jgi:hypothetical protein
MFCVSPLLLLQKLREIMPRSECYCLSPRRTQTMLVESLNKFGTSDDWKRSGLLHLHGFLLHPFNCYAVALHIGHRSTRLTSLSQYKAAQYLRLAEEKGVKILGNTW